MLLLDIGNHSAKIWDNGMISSKSIDELNSFCQKRELII